MAKCRADFATGIENKRYFQNTASNWPFQGIAVT